MKNKLIFPLIAICLILNSCFEDRDDNVAQSSTNEINNFVYRALNYFYLYKADTPELANDAFENADALNNFLNNYNTPETLFEFLRSPVDRFSVLFDNFDVIENALNGVSLNNGLEYGLVRYPDGSNKVFGYARYILPNTAAETAGLMRGAIFNTINGVQITDTNFNELLSPESYEIGLATFDGTNIEPTGTTVQLNKTQYTENPIFIAKTLTVQGQKIGYIMYNAFTGSFDSQLNSAFGQLKTEGITDLVIDLRYNGGGSVNTAKGLSTMITGQFTGQLYFKEFWNADRQQQFSEDSFFEDSFNGQAINSLNLTRVYVLTTSRTASASELVINTLNPYINVVQIGDDTTGKFQASILLYDAPAPNFSRSLANPGHKYAMLPLVFKTANSVGFTDYINGLVPDISIRENYSNLGQLGEPGEPLLDIAIADIVGTPKPFDRTIDAPEEISDSKANSPINQRMLVKR